MHLHILGVCGTFMAGIAAIAREAGHRVTGSDANAWPPMSTQLEALGIELMRGYEPGHLQPRPDMVVVGNVVTRGNPAMEYVLDENLPYTSGPQWLAENVLRDRHVLAVAGTHGKTTTSALLAWLLEHAGLAPGFLIGGVPQNFGISARLGGSKYFVIEGDEYDTAFFDKRSKFVHYRPRTCVLNNLEYDHADIFPDLASIERQFHHLVRTVPSSGRIVVNGTDANLARVLDMGCWSERVAFNDPQGWQAEVAEGGFVLRVNGIDRGVVASGLVGSHNRANALAAFAAADHVGVPLDQLADGLAAFRNVRRRLEVVGSVRGVTVYDDFAHHPTAIEVTIDALRGQGRGRVLAVLEPRSNTMRLGTHAGELAHSLRAADLCFVYARPDLNWDAQSALAGVGERLRVHADLDDLVAAIAAAARANDRVLVMSNGDFGGVHARILNALG
jgi:UDP-N-acetylmuramate: L-alanyl-gamma-D-glutamyl-meso-diaminopimelate ligase